MMRGILLRSCSPGVFWYLLIKNGARSLLVTVLLPVLTNVEQFIAKRTSKMWNYIIFFGDKQRDKH